MKKSRYLSLLFLAGVLTSAQASASLLQSLSIGFVAFSSMLGTGQTQTVGYHKLGGRTGNDISSGMVLNSADDILFSGYTESNGWVIGLKKNALFMRYNDAGTFQAGKSYGKSGGGAKDNEFKDITLLDNGQVLMGGFTRNYGATKKDWFFVKTDSNGNLVAAYRSGLSDNDEVESVAAATSDNGWFGAGWRRDGSTKKRNAMIARYAASGTTVTWSKELGESNNHDMFRSVAVNPATGANDVTAVGYTQSFADIQGVLAANYNYGTGALNWALHIGGTPAVGSFDSYEEDAYSVVYDNNDNVYIAGYARKDGLTPETYAMLLKLDTNTKTTSWVTLFGEDSDEVDKIVALDYDSTSDTLAFAGYTDGGYGTNGLGIIAGTVNATSGAINWLNTVDTSANEQATGVRFNSNGDVVVTGWTDDSNGAGANDYVIAKLDGDDTAADCGTTESASDDIDASWIAVTEITNHPDLTDASAGLTSSSQGSNVATTTVLGPTEYTVC